jgi:hypothetical protein
MPTDIAPGWPCGGGKARCRASRLTIVRGGASTGTAPMSASASAIACTPGRTAPRPRPAPLCMHGDPLSLTWDGRSTNVQAWGTATATGRVCRRGCASVGRAGRGGTVPPPPGASSPAAGSLGGGGCCSPASGGRCGAGLDCGGRGVCYGEDRCMCHSAWGGEACTDKCGAVSGELQSSGGNTANNEGPRLPPSCLPPFLMGLPK